MIAQILDSGLVFSVVDGGLKVKGPKSELAELLPIIKQWKPELLKIAAGESVANVDQCEHCNAKLLGLLVHGDYVNRVCPECGRWAICLPPDWTPEELEELVTERAAIMEHQGGLLRVEADVEAREIVRLQVEAQKALAKNPRELSCAEEQGSVESFEEVADRANDRRPSHPTVKELSNDG